MSNAERLNDETDINKLAERDRFVSETFHLRRPKLKDRNGVIRREFHLRGGKRLGIREPNGGTIIFDSNDVVHDYDESGNLLRRYTLQNPPEGFIVMSIEELNQLSSDENIVCFGKFPIGIDLILH